MNAAGWDALTEEIIAKLEAGKAFGESPLDTMTRLIWLERRGKVAMKSVSPEGLPAAAERESSDKCVFRRNLNGTVDAICEQCFMTAATGFSIEQARERSSAHDCLVDPVVVVRRQRVMVDREISRAEWHDLQPDQDASERCLNLAKSFVSEPRISS